MDFIRRLFKKQHISDPIALRSRLFETANRRDNAALLDLCTANRAVILQHFPEWTNIRNYTDINPKDARQFQFMINGLGKIAEAFRDKLGDSSLWDRLIGPPAESPFIRFEQTLKAAKDLAGEMRHREAADLLSSYLIDIKDLQGPGADNFRAYAHGMIGMCLSQSNRAVDALPHLRQALSYCTSLNDKEGIHVYLRQLYDVHRYLGESDEAASYAERLADYFEGKPESPTWRASAARVRAGEPLLRMIAQQGDHRKELDQLTEIEGSVTYLFERNRPTLAPSTSLLSQGDKIATEGKYNEALALYRDAARADPFNPHPHYHAGVTLLLLERYPEAVEEYETVLRLAPGWFNIGSDLWIAHELLAGRLTHDAFLAAWTAENAAIDPSEKLALLEKALVRHPALPNLHFLHGLTLLTLARKEEAIAAFDAGLAVDPEPDIHSRLLAQRAILCDSTTRHRFLRQILQLPNPNLMSRTLAEVMLKHSAK